MIIRVTEKVKKKTKIGNLVHLVMNRKMLFFEEWYVNLFIMNRKPFFMFTEGMSLFSLIGSAKGVNSQVDFEHLFGESINNFLGQFLPGNQHANIPVVIDQYSKTENGRILKNQCDQIYHAKKYIESGRDTFLINRIPLKAIGFRSPADAFIEEFQKVLQLKGILLIPETIKN